jgi:hypothetical protein
MTPRTATAAPAGSPPSNSPQTQPRPADSSTPPEPATGFGVDPQQLDRCSDAALVDAAIGCQVAENAARAGRLAAIMAFEARQEPLDGGRRPASSSFFTLTPVQATTSEFAPGLAVSDRYVEIGLDIATRLSTLFPNFWAMCRAGRLDLGRAEILLSTVDKFANEDDIADFAASMDEFIAKFDDPGSPICTVTRSSLQRAAWRRKHRYPRRLTRRTSPPRSRSAGSTCGPVKTGSAHSACGPWSPTR